MKLSKIYYFLGSVYFALLLIAFVALFVIAGTLIESSTQSHRYAAQLTYRNPFFVLLLWAFFINILFSALQRWPFKVRHIPFLITHFGLLMVFGGVLSKVYFGVQGTLQIMEGAASHHMSEADTYVVQVEQRGEKPYSYEIALFNLPEKAFNYQTPLSVFSVLKKIYHRNHREHRESKMIEKVKPKLFLKPIDYLPNSTERLATWIKGKHAIIQGLPPLSVHEISDLQDDDEIPVSGKVRFHDQNVSTWEVYALRTNDISQTINKLYRQKSLLKISDRASGTTLATQEMAFNLDTAIPLTDKSGNYGEAIVHLDLGFSEINGFSLPLLELKVLNTRDQQTYEIQVPLQGDTALLNVNRSTPHLSNSPIAVDILRTPMLAFLEDQYNDTYLVVFDARGQVWSQLFGSHHLQSYLAYDEGFGGYSIQCELPFPDFICGREQRETALIDYLSMQMRQVMSTKTQLSPPLHFLQEACREANVDFVDALMAFLRQWDSQHSWLYAKDQDVPKSIEKVFKCVKWQGQPETACYWTAQFFEHIEPVIAKGGNLLDALRETHWPLVTACEELWNENQNNIAEKTGALMNLLTQQIFSAVLDKDQLPTQNTGQQHARLLSAYLRAYNIHLSTMTPVLPAQEMQQLIQKNQKGNESQHVESLLPSIETPLAALLEEAPLNKKLEDNIPAITLRAQEGNHAQTITLSYDRFASGLKWPILNGKYLLRFQPHFLEIPYSIRLRQARQINYANSQQVFSYESDVIITNLRTGENIEKTISMNQVHETWDGYRFYLSNITPGDESSVKRIQIVVNRDPAKYWLTYPGAIILCLGIVFLFWIRPYKKSR